MQDLWSNRGDQVLVPGSSFLRSFETEGLEKSGPEDVKEEYKLKEVT
jgi:hypothetical protein